MASTVPHARGRVSTGLLTISGLLAGAWFVSPLCYWKGRTFGAGLADEFRPINWQPDLAPMYVIALVIGIAWIVLWFLHARRTRHLGLSLLHAVVPAAAFGFSAVFLSYSAMACGAY